MEEPCCCGAEGAKLQAATQAAEWAEDLSRLDDDKEAFDNGQLWALPKAIVGASRSTCPYPSGRR